MLLSPRLALVIACAIAQTASASAMLGGEAKRGDNCTPYNSFKIGYAVPGGTIVSQNLVLANGWLVAGWLLDTASGARYYVPNPRYFDHRVDERSLFMAGPPAFELLHGLDSKALNVAYRQSRELRKQYSSRVYLDSPAELPALTLVAPCFATPLNL